MSLVVLVYSAVLTSELQDFEEVVNEGAIITPLVFAAFMFVVSVVGICAVRQRSKIMLLIYLIAAFVITLTVLVSGSVLLVLSDELEDSENQRVIEGSSSIEARINDFGLGVYQTCCFDAFENLDAPQSCSAEVDLVCISDQLRFEDFAQSIPDSLCEFLEDVDIDNVVLVGDPAVIDGACGGGDPELFVQRVTDYLAENIRPLGIVNVVLAVVMLLDLIMSCILLFSNREDYGYSGEKKEKQQGGEYQEQAAPETAEGQVKY